MKNYKLSILLVTFNHEAYIHQAMRSILGQKIDGPVELVIADDGSEDQTREIIRSYEGADARFHFKYLDHFPSLGITKNYKRGFAVCSGEYVAVIEGDDYWCNPFKLQRQSNFLDIQLQCDLCSVNYYVFEEERCQFTPRIAIGGGHKFVGARDLIADNLVGNFSTCMYRKTALDALPVKLFDIKSYDWIVNICVAMRGLIGILEEPMSVYRLHAMGAWTQVSHVEKIRQQLELIPVYDELTENVFKAEFDLLAIRLGHVITVSQVVNVFESAVQPVAWTMPNIAEYIPPIIMVVLRGLIPPIMKRFFVRLLIGGRGA